MYTESAMSRAGGKNSNDGAAAKRRVLPAQIAALHRPPNVPVVATRVRAARTLAGSLFSGQDGARPPAAKKQPVTRIFV